MQPKPIIETIGEKVGFGVGLLIFTTIFYHILSGFDIIPHVDFMTLISVVLVIYIIIAIIKK